MKKWYLLLAIDRGIINDRWDFEKKIAAMSKLKMNTSGPWRVKAGVRFSCNILSADEAIEKKFLDNEGNLLFWGYPGDGSITFNIFGFNSEDEAVNFGALMEDCFIGVI